ncbi:MAG TPA: Imm21 family immunity protein [Pirellulales bacterium]|nr:Imm21 family immunity protein [Pirellulales bacterium]
MAQQSICGIWFVNDGGPLIVLPRELLGYWQGDTAVPGRGGSSVGSDYKRACEAVHPAALLTVGPGFGLVIGAQDHIGTANWLVLTDQPVAALVGWSYGDDDSEAMVIELLRKEALPWRRLPCTIALSHGDVVLFHAASRGEELRELSSADGYAVIGGCVPLRLDPGHYMLEVLEAGGNLDHDSFGCVICRWVHVQRSD